MVGDITRIQIERLSLDGDRPLIICDVDEVVVHFLRALEVFLAGRQCWLDPASFALNGNVRRRETNEPVSTDELGDLLHAFFAAETANFEAIEGAADGLGALSAHADIVMLTNLPETYYDDRRQNLERHGMTYPVVVNSGPKGPAVDLLVGTRSAPVIFLDDSPSNIESVRETVPDTHIVHFMQDERFARHIDDFGDIFLTTDNWAETTDRLGELLVRTD